MSHTLTPTFTDFDAEGCTFLGQVVWANELFDLYHSPSVVAGVCEVIAVHKHHNNGGPMAMETAISNNYPQGHPLKVAHGLVMMRRK